MIDHLLEAAIIVCRCTKDNGLDKEGLVAMVFFITPDDAEAPAARVAPAQYNLMVTVEVAGRQDNREHCI